MNYEPFHMHGLNWIPKPQVLNTYTRDQCSFMLLTRLSFLDSAPRHPWALRSPWILAVAGFLPAGFTLLLTWTRFCKPMASKIIVQPTHAVVPDQRVIGLCSKEWNTTARCLPTSRRGIVRLHAQGPHVVLGDFITFPRRSVGDSCRTCAESIRQRQGCCIMHAPKIGTNQTVHAVRIAH